jgi:hypothetical protein
VRSCFAGPRDAVRWRPPEAAVPAGRLGYDLAAARLLLHTVIDEDGYETLRASGVVRGEPARTPVEFEDAYAFMRAEHARRIPGSSGGPLLWAWARTTRAHLLATVRETARCRQRPQVLLTCRVPRERVLLSEFVAWHDVLLTCLAVDDLPPEAQEEAIDAFFEERDRDGLGELPLAQWPQALRDRLLDSWQRIFDRNAHPHGSTWQGCVEHLETDDVLDAVGIWLPRGRSHATRSAAGTEAQGPGAPRSDHDGPATTPRD